MVGLVTRNSQIARIGDLWFFIWRDSRLTEPSWLGRLHCRQVSVQVRAVRVGLVWSIRANQQHSKNLPGFFSQTSDHLSVASVSYGFSDFSFSPWEKTQKEWRCRNTNPKKKKKNGKKRYKPKSDSSLSKAKFSNWTPQIPKLVIFLSQSCYLYLRVNEVSLPLP